MAFHKIIDFMAQSISHSRDYGEELHPKGVGCRPPILKVEFNIV